MAKRINNDMIMGFSDNHEPYSHKDTLKFLCAVRDKYNPDRIIHLGDATDSYTFSSYAKSLDAENAPDEIKNMRKNIKKIAKEFPKLDIMQSNHDDRLYRKAKVAGIPRDLVLPYTQFIGVDDVDWKWHPDLTLTIDATREKIYFAHTRTGTALSLAKHIGMSCCIGHHHTRSGIQWYRSPSHTIWGLDSGCLISDTGHAFSYNSASAIRPVRSCFIINKGIPKIIPMGTKGKGAGRWDGKVA